MACFRLVRFKTSDAPSDHNRLTLGKAAVQY